MCLAGKGKGLNEEKSKLMEELKQEDLVERSTEDLRQGGLLSQKLDGYEERPAQIEMARLVAQALTGEVPALLEAGTGVGKSLGYLIPVVRSRKVAIVSTANKVLQEQLFYKDIPFVQKHIRHFEAAMVKGVQNYVCLARVDKERAGVLFHPHKRELQQLLDTMQDADSSWNGDFEMLGGFQLPPELRARVATDSEQCTWNKCAFFSECYVRDMREQADVAQVIVVNHTLLLLDAAVGGLLLPERDVIILDEAHHLEEEATRTFTTTIGPTHISSLLAQHRLRNYAPPHMQDEIAHTVAEVWSRLEDMMDDPDPSSASKRSLRTPLIEGVQLASLIKTLAAELAKRRDGSAPAVEKAQFDRLLKRTSTLADHLQLVFSVDQPDRFVYYVERTPLLGSPTGRSTRSQLQVSAAPLNVTDWLREKLFEKWNVVCVSATLATLGVQRGRQGEGGPSFSYFRRRVGLEQSETLERILPPAFDYQRKALLYLAPRGMPEPAYRRAGVPEQDYVDSIVLQMLDLVRASHGRAFLLFSSKGMLNRVYEQFSMEANLNYPLLKQGDMTRIELVRRFRTQEGSVLFGLKSFWEGVDIAGDALSLVVIDKLPFDPPDDPVHEARIALMKAAGENWFEGYVLPQAVLRLKQGLGRLLRTHEDRGVMAVLDTRLHTKGYGKFILRALYQCPTTTRIDEVVQFYDALGV